MALGYEHVNLLSESYGTRVAQVYAAAHADRVARSAMIGVNPPGRFVWEPVIIDQQLRYYAELYLKASAGRQTVQNLAGMMHDVVRTLPERWGPIRLDRGKIRVVTFAMLFNRRTAALVFDAFIAAASGDFSGLALLSVASDVVVPRLFTWGDFLAKGATADYEAGRDYATDLDPADSIIGSPMSLLIFDGLADGAWPVQRPASTPRSAQRSDVQSLLLSGTVDFSTPAELATRELLPSLPNGKQVIVAEAGHVDDLWNLQRAATEQLLVSFFDTGIADDTGFTYVPMDFHVPISLQLISKSATAAIAALLVGSGIAAWRLGSALRDR